MTTENKAAWPSDDWYKEVATKHAAYAETMKALQAPYGRAMDYKEGADPIFSVDAFMGKLLSIFAIIGAFSFFLAICIFVGYLS